MSICCPAARAEEREREAREGESERETGKTGERRAREEPSLFHCIRSQAERVKEEGERRREKDVRRGGRRLKQECTCRTAAEKERRSKRAMKGKGSKNECTNRNITSIQQHPGNGFAHLLNASQLSVQSAPRLAKQKRMREATLAV